jgi:hypothetical protein
MADIPPPHSLRGQDEILAERGTTQMPLWQNIEGRPFEFRRYDYPPPADPRQRRWTRFRDWSLTDDPSSTPCASPC